MRLRQALQELVLYFLRERLTEGNLKLTNLIITNVTKWYIFDAQLFEKLFAENKQLVKNFVEFEAKKLSNTKTSTFYNEIAKPFIEKIKDQLEYTFFDLESFKKKLFDDKKIEDKDLVALYKILSPQHLLKLPILNDSNTLDRNFYNELLHIIGLTETKNGNKKLIDRLENGRLAGSLLENTINQLDSLDKLARIPNVIQFGETHEKRLFNVALELCITWINRILFLKLLESQLISYHKGDKSHSFLNSDLLQDYDNLNALFFMVLAKKPEERNERVKKIFAKVPYLNSSLFEPTELEHQTIFIAGLEDNIPLPFMNGTVLKDARGKNLNGNKNAIDYLFEFLDAYNYANEGKEEIQEENKTIIKASVLGLIFEKINGYKDGSFYTPGFITMYMCRETIRRAVVQKFNEAKGWNCKNFDELKEDIQEEIKVGNRKEVRKIFNQIINSLRIVDPSVGSGHFLVSGLNEIIAIKSELKILVDQDFEPLSNYQITVQNDEIIIKDNEDNFFKYNPKSKESQRVQETLFHEKQTIIENCLFGVDINPNSVKICRLRLWIELLKSAYYKNETELETLPNIDINIKCGNSLISRFALDADLKQALKKSNRTISDYKNAVKSYQNATSKEEKRNMEELILQIKQSFSTEIRLNDPLRTKLQKLSTELYHRFTGSFLFEPETPYGKTEKELEKKRNSEKEKLESEINKIEKHFEEVKNNKIYENAFEWRFEFPEVLNDEGDFVGFDVVIGNPPYGAFLSESEKQVLLLKYKNQDYQLDTYLLFIEQSLNLMRDCSEFTFIIPNTWISNLKFKKMRRFIFENTFIHEIVHYKKAVFEEAVVDTEVLFFKKLKKPNINVCIKISQDINHFSTNWNSQVTWIENQGEPVNINLNVKETAIKLKLEGNKQLNEFVNVYSGMNPYEVGKGNPKQTREMVKARVYDSNYKIDDSYKRVLRGSDINKFYLNWESNVWIKYGDNLAAPRYSANFLDDEKLVVRQTSDKLIATIDKEQFVCLKNLHVISKIKDGIEINFKYILGLLNSKLLDFYYTLLNPEKGEALAEVKKENLSKLPIILADNKIQRNIENLVNQILSSKSSDKSADTTALETQIDQMVYELYGLTEEEIKIVEG